MESEKQLTETKRYSVVRFSVGTHVLKLNHVVWADDVRFLRKNNNACSYANSLNSLAKHLPKYVRIFDFKREDSALLIQMIQQKPFCKLVLNIKGYYVFYLKRNSVNILYRTQILTQNVIKLS